VVHSISVTSFLRGKVFIFFPPISVFLFSCIIALEVLPLSLLMVRYEIAPEMWGDGRRRMDRRVEVWNRKVASGLGVVFFSWEVAVFA